MVVTPYIVTPLVGSWQGCFLKIISSQPLTCPLQPYDSQNTPFFSSLKVRSSYESISS